MKTMQYTIRDVPASVDLAVRELARKTHHSLNATLLETLRRGLGMAAEQPECHDLDDLAGTWIADPEYDKAMEMFESIDEDLWR
jgi:hypothetical protein